MYENETHKRIVILFSKTMLSIIKRERRSNRASLYKRSTLFILFLPFLFNSTQLSHGALCEGLFDPSVERNLRKTPFTHVLDETSIHTQEAHDFVTEFWTPKTGILKVSARVSSNGESEFIVFVPSTHYNLVKEGLPKKFRSTKITIFEFSSEEIEAHKRKRRSRIDFIRKAIVTHLNLLFLSSPLQREKHRKPVVLVTGTSQGLGLELVKKLYESGKYRVIATTREKSIETLRSELEQVGISEETDGFRIRKLDVSNTEEQEALVKESQQDWGGIDVLVNNAAIVYRSVIEDMTHEQDLVISNTNVLGPVNLMRLVAPTMRMKGRGRIVNVSSAAGMMAMPTMGAYSASKFGLEGFSEAFYYELRPFGVRVSLVQPGFIRSQSHENTLLTEKARARAANDEDPYYVQYVNMTGFVKKFMASALYDASKVANVVIDTIENKNPPLRKTGTPDVIIFNLLRRFLPGPVYHKFLYHMLPGVNHWSPPTIPKLYQPIPSVEDLKIDPQE